MAILIALYRGINVVGKNQVKMEALRAMHEKLGHRGVKNYIQSGNIIFSAAGSPDAAARKIAAEFAKTFSFAPKVLVVEANHWGTIVKGNPYAAAAAEDPKTVHLGLCEGEPSESGLKALLAKTGVRERFVVGKGFLYLHAPDGYGTSKFASGMERAAGVPMTVRNWRTVQKLWEMANANG